MNCVIMVKSYYFKLFVFDLLLTRYTNINLLIEMSNLVAKIKHNTDLTDSLNKAIKVAN